MNVTDQADFNKTEFDAEEILAVWLPENLLQTL
jgi:hypothetical protein